MGPNTEYTRSTPYYVFAFRLFYLESMPAYVAIFQTLAHFTSHWPISDAKTVLLNLLELYDVQKGDLVCISCV